MDFKQLEIFLCVAKHLNFSKAAEELYISQPSVSAQINALEKTLQSQLLIRNTKSASLTDAGRDLLVYAQRILTLRDQAVHQLLGKDRQARGTIDIIASTIPAQFLLPAIVASFQEVWQNTIFRLEQADSHRVEQDMGSFRYDFGMVGTVPDAERFTSYPIYDDELVVVVPNSEPCSNDSIRSGFADFIRKTPFIMREVGSGTRKEIETVFTAYNIDVRDLRIPAYFPDAHGILLAVSRGVGASLISGVAARMFADAGMLRMVEMHNPVFRRQIYLLYNKELWLTPVQQAFVDHAREFYTSDAQ